MIAPDFTVPAVIDGPYRYSLTREWAGTGTRPMVFIMLNPSTADAVDDDATIARCRNRAMLNDGFSRLVVVNLYALRTRNPRKVANHPEPVGLGNDDWILAAASLPGAFVVAAWGAHTFAIERGNHVTRMITAARVPLHCLGTTKDGWPRHPLYVRSLKPFESYPVAA